MKRGASEAEAFVALAAARADAARVRQTLAAISALAQVQFDYLGSLPIVPGAVLQGFAQQVESLANAVLWHPSVPTDTQSKNGGAP